MDDRLSSPETTEWRLEQVEEEVRRLAEVARAAREGVSELEYEVRMTNQAIQTTVGRLNTSMGSLDQSVKDLTLRECKSDPRIEKLLEADIRRQEREDNFAGWLRFAAWAIPVVLTVQIAILSAVFWVGASSARLDAKTSQH